MTKTIEEIVVDFYTTFKGNKFEASFCKLKEVEGKVAPYFMEDWIRETIKQIQSDLLKEILGKESLVSGMIWIGDIKKLAEDEGLTLN